MAENIFKDATTGPLRNGYQYDGQEYLDRQQAMRKYGYVRGDEERLVFVKIVDDVCKTKENAVLQVLSVGSGEGVNDVLIIDELTGQAKQVNYVVVEPLSEKIQNFKDLVTSRHQQGKWNNVSFDFHTCTIDEYLRERTKGQGIETFDLIHLIHSIYHFPNAEETMVALYNTLGQGGVLANMQQSLRGGYGFFMASDCVMKLHTEEVRRDALKFDDIEDSLGRRLPDARYEAHNTTRPINISECFKEDSRDGNLLLDFVTGACDLSKHVTEEYKNKILLLLRELSEDVDGQIILPAIEVVMTYTKV